MRLVLLGPPGAGKGTQAVMIAKKYSVLHISTGDIFRMGVKGGSRLGLQAARYLNRGELVPDVVVNSMMADRLARDDVAEGWISDGYPRTVPQAQALEDVLDELGQRLDAALKFNVPTEELTRRLAQRAGEEGRTDDSEKAVRRRLEEYERKTAPLADFYRRRDLLRDIDAVGPLDEVTERVVQVLVEHSR